MKVITRPGVWPAWNESANFTGEDLVQYALSRSSAGKLNTLAEIIGALGDTLPEEKRIEICWLQYWLEVEK